MSRDRVSKRVEVVRKAASLCHLQVGFYPIKVSILRPKAFSKCKAISGDKKALPFKSLDKAGLITTSILDTVVMARLRGSTTSSFKKTPGCGGLYIRNVLPLCCQASLFRFIGPKRISTPLLKEQA